MALDDSSHGAQFLLSYTMLQVQTGMLLDIAYLWSDLIADAVKFPALCLLVVAVLWYPPGVSVVQASLTHPTPIREAAMARYTPATPEPKRAPALAFAASTQLSSYASTIAKKYTVRACSHG